LGNYIAAAFVTGGGMIIGQSGPGENPPPLQLAIPRA
jgi:hypothetical protein